MTKNKEFDERTTKLIGILRNLKFVNTFNPYSDVCEIHDKKDGAYVRTDNLKMAIEGSLNKQATLFVGRDLGYKGGRRTGIALTDEIHLPIYGKKLNVEFKKATVGFPVGERTSFEIWRYLSYTEAPVFFWNVFPLHPFNSGYEFSNRKHTRIEARECKNVLDLVIDIINPSKLIAIGRDAEAALSDYSIPFLSTRHPSYGGQREFRRFFSTQFHSKPENQCQLEFNL